MYIVVRWPEVQDYMLCPGFSEHSYLINDEKGIEEFGSSAYFVDVDWMKEAEKKLFRKDGI